MHSQKILWFFIKSKNLNSNINVYTPVVGLKCTETEFFLSDSELFLQKYSFDGFQNSDLTFLCNNPFYQIKSFHKLRQIFLQL